MFFKKKSAKYTKGDIAKIKELLMQNEECLIIDVRDEKEFTASHIKGTINIPLNKIFDYFKKNNITVEIPIYVLCSYGNRSRKAAMYLAGYGYKNVTDFGGIVNWPYELVNSGDI